MSRVYRLISGVALRRPPTSFVVSDALLKGARRIVPTTGAHDSPDYILVRRRGRAIDAIGSDWAAIGADISAAYHVAAGETGVLVESARAAGQVAAHSDE